MQFSQWAVLTNLSDPLHLESLGLTAVRLIGLLWALGVVVRRFCCFHGHGQSTGACHPQQLAGLYLLFGCCALGAAGQPGKTTLSALLLSRPTAARRYLRLLFMFAAIPF